MAKELFNAIIFFDPKVSKPPVKYHNISNFENFKKFVAKKFEAAYYFNLYRKSNKTFYGRIWIKDFV